MPLLSDTIMHTPEVAGLSTGGQTLDRAAHSWRKSRLVPNEPAKVHSVGDPVSHLLPNIEKMENSWLNIACIQSVRADCQNTVATLEKMSIHAIELEWTNLLDILCPTCKTSICVWSALAAESMSDRSNKTKKGGKI